MEKKQRNVLVDVLKAYAIFLVVLGHVIQTFNPEWQTNGFEMAIVMFHMPLFIAISGYFFVKSAEKCNASQLIKKRFIQLMFPSLTMGFLECLTIGGGKLLKHKAFEIDYFLNTFFTGLWFLTTLFILTVIGALIYHKFKVTPRFYLSWLFVWAILYLLPDVWVLNQLEFLCPFYVMGIAARNLDLHKVKPWVLIVAVVLFSLCLSRYTFDCSMYKMGAECLSLQYLRDTGLRIIGGVSGIVISLFFAKLLTNLSFGQAMLAKVGMLTLPIYVLHQKFLLVNLFLKYTTENLCYCALISVLLTAITISAYKILHRNKYIALFLFGENKKQI